MNKFHAPASKFIHGFLMASGEEIIISTAQLLKECVISSSHFYPIFIEFASEETNTSAIPKKDFSAYSGEKGHLFRFYPDSKIGKKNPQNHNA